MVQPNVRLKPESLLAKCLLALSILIEVYTALSGILFVSSKGPHDDLPYQVNAVATYVRFYLQSVKSSRHSRSRQFGILSAQFRSYCA